jgi:hypothetical protein
MQFFSVRGKWSWHIILFGLIVHMKYGKRKKKNPLRSKYSRDYPDPTGYQAVDCGPLSVADLVLSRVGGTRD